MKSLLWARVWWRAQPATVVYLNAGTGKVEIKLDATGQQITVKVTDLKVRFL